MNKKKNRGGAINPLNWEKYQEDNEELYSYLKKKGKHKRVDDQKTNKE